MAGNCSGKRAELQKMNTLLSFDWDTSGEVTDEEVAERLWDRFLATGSKVEFLKDWTPTYKSSDPKRRGSLLTRKKTLHFDEFGSSKKDGMSPLMKAVEANYIRTAFSLLMYGANPNLQHPETGDTALHIAVTNANLLMVKALLIVNADTTIANNNKELPFDIAVKIQQSFHTPDIKLALVSSVLGIIRNVDIPNTREIPESAKDGDIDGIIETLGEAYTLQTKTLKYFHDNPSLPEEPSPKGTYLLSVDGGGVRAFNITQTLVNIEERMSQLTSDKCHNLYKYFDYIAGTSSGGIAACALPYRKVCAYSGRAMVHRGVTHVFGGPYAERGDRMDVFLQDIFTPDMRMNDLDPSSRSIVTGSLATVLPFKLHLMTSYGEARNGQAGPGELKVWEACRITTSAPIYFPILRDFKILDGALVANNPTLPSMADIMAYERSEGKTVKFACVVSIGTGEVPVRDTKKEDVTIFEPSTFALLQNISQNYSALKNLISHTINQVAESDGQQVIQSREFCHALGSRYFRLTPPLKEYIDMATGDLEVLIDMLYDTQMYYLDHPELIDDVAKLLLGRQDKTVPL